MSTFHLRRRGVSVAALIAFGSLASANPGLGEGSPSVPLDLPAATSVPIADPVAPPAEPIAPASDPAVEEEEAAFESIGEGEASYYGHELAGNRTASGERFDPNALTAAHRTLPLGTRLRVTNTRNGKSVVVRINDRGPFVKRRLIDVSLGAARKINMVRAGTALVRLDRLR